MIPGLVEFRVVYQKVQATTIRTVLEFPGHNNDVFAKDLGVLFDEVTHVMHLVRKRSRLELSCTAMILTMQWFP